MSKTKTYEVLKRVFYYINEPNKSYSIREISESLEITWRSVKAALKTLYEMQLVEKTITLGKKRELYHMRALPIIRKAEGQEHGGKME